MTSFALQIVLNVQITGAIIKLNNLLTSFKLLWNPNMFSGLKTVSTGKCSLTLTVKSVVAILPVIILTKSDNQTHHNQNFSQRSSPRQRLRTGTIQVLQKNFNYNGANQLERTIQRFNHLLIRYILLIETSACHGLDL